MIEFSIGLVTGIITIGIYKSGAIIQYEEERRELIEENKELTAKLNKVLKRNESLNNENERFKNRIIELLGKLGVRSL